MLWSVVWSKSKTLPSAHKDYMGCPAQYVIMYYYSYSQLELIATMYHSYESADILSACRASHPHHYLDYPKNLQNMIHQADEHKCSDCWLATVPREKRKQYIILIDNTTWYYKNFDNTIIIVKLELQPNKVDSTQVHAIISLNIQYLVSCFLTLWPEKNWPAPLVFVH